MRKIKDLFKVVKSSVKWGEDKTAKTDATSSFFKQAEAKDIPKSKYDTFYSNSNDKVKVESRLRELDRVILTGRNRELVESKIEQIVLQAKSNQIPDYLKDACEIAHYAVTNDTPVRVSVIRQLVPNIDLKESDIIDEMAYEEYLRFKDKEDNIREATIEVEDTYGMRNEDGRGKKDHTQWGKNK